MESLLTKYPDRIPVIIKKKESDRFLEDLPNSKYLIPRSFKLSDLIILLRKKNKMDSSKAIFLFVDNILAPNNITMEELYYHYSDNGYLYITYCSESTFG